ncbi:MAG: hypothetical protein MZV65_47290 [Chromatiales bacterium]|nr:hypothetical protein [Chromatiales bacterium]
MMAASGFRDSTRLAASDVMMMLDIMLLESRWRIDGFSAIASVVRRR